MTRNVPSFAYWGPAKSKFVLKPINARDRSREFKHLSRLLEKAGAARCAVFHPDAAIEMARH
jgi:hypothetical protein